MSEITEADWLEGRDNWRERYGRDDDTPGYTPTTDEVREAVSEWVWSRRMFRPELEGSDGAEFDRWTEARDKQILSAAADHIEEQHALIGITAESVVAGLRGDG